jgi:hypothetical protein
VDQKEVDHAGDSVGAIDSRGAILQDVDVIDHGEGYQVNVRTSASASAGQRTISHPFAINENQGLLGQQAAQVKLDGAVTGVADVQVDSPARLLRDEFLQVGCTANAQFLDVLRTVCVHGVRAGLFRSGNVRTGYDDAFDLSRGRRSSCRLGWHSRSRQLRECVRRKD